MKILKKIFKYLSNFLIGILVVFCIYAIAATTFFKQSYVNVFGHTFFVVATGSMSGSININDAVVVKITHDFKVNDIITYANDGYFITHRVISLKDDEIITKGDINNTQDDPITYGDVIGKVVFIFPFSVIFQILGSLIVIFVIIVVFNFEKIFKKYILDKAVPSLEQKETKKAVEQDPEYSVFIKSILNVMKERNKNGLSTPEADWIRNLKYVTKIKELVKAENYELLKKLVNFYEINSISNDILDIPIVMQLKDKTYSTYVILLLNSITYQDLEMFNVLFSCLKFKVNYEFKRGLLKSKPNIKNIFNEKN